MTEHQARSLREDSELGKPRLATKSDVSWLAGIISWASTARVEGPLREICAAACFFGYRSEILRRVRAKQVWHADRELMLIVVPLGWRVRSGRVPRMLLTGFAFSIVLTGMAPLAGAIALPLLIILAVIWSLPTLLMLPFSLSKTMRRSRMAGKTWIASLDEPAYSVAWLAKREGVEWGSGVPFAKEALKVALPPGTPIVAMASEPKEVRFLRALGFMALQCKGEATRAMVRRT